MISHSRPAIEREDWETVKKVLSSGEIAQGKRVLEFEEELAEFIGVKGGVALSSGTAAIHLSLLALGIGKGDEVILPSFVCAAPYQAVLYTGAKVRLVDINPDDYNINFKETKKKLNRRTKAILIPYMFGQPAGIQPFLSLGVPVIEDCAQALGADLSGKKAGSFGKISICSFYATKLMTTGEGGMVLSNSRRILNQVRNWRNYNQRDIRALKFNYKMTNFQAALGISQLKKLPSFIDRRRSIAERFNRAFKENIFFKTPVSKGARIYYRYVLRTQKNTAQIIKSLNKEGIDAQRPVFKPLHQYLGLKGFPETDRAYREALSIPIYPALKEDEIKRIIKAVNELAV